MRNILIFGGLGFVGSHFINLLSEKNPKTYITNVDQLNNQRKNRLHHELCHLENYRLLSTDITTEEGYQLIFAHNYDAIVQFEPEGHLNQLDSFHSSVIGTVRLLEALKEGKAKRMLHVSNRYRSINDKTEIPGYTYDIQSFKNSEQTALSFIRAYLEAYQIPIILASCCQVFGEKQHTDELIPNTIIRALSDETITLEENGRLQRDWIYVEDYCNGLYQALIRGRIGESYIFSSNERKKDIDVARNILHRLHKPAFLVQIIDSKVTTSPFYFRKLRKIQPPELDWKPMHTFGEALEKTIAYYEGCFTSF